MSRSRAGIVWVLVALGVASTPMSSDAGGRGHSGGGGHSFAGPTRVDNPGRFNGPGNFNGKGPGNFNASGQATFDHYFGQHFGRGDRGHRRFQNNTTIIYSAPLDYYVPQPVYEPPPAYYAPPQPAYYSPAVYSTPPMAAAPPPPPAAPPPQTPRVVEFSNGRYELRGDGLSAPYQWVWIPNPPTEPPAEAGPPVRRPSPTLYRWTDANGVTVWTDDINKVPERFRAEAAKPAP